MTTPQNKIKYGFRNIYFAPITETELSGVKTITYDKPFHHKGAINMTLDANGDTMEFYADDGLFANDTPNNGYTGSLELAKINDEFNEKILGLEKNADGVYLENRDTKVKSFAMLCETNGDVTQTRFAFYNIKATRPGQNNKTTEKTNTPATDIINITVLPAEDTGNIKAFCAKGEKAYEAWFESVYVSGAVTENL